LENVEICEGNVCDKESLVDFFHTEGYDCSVLIYAAAIVTIQSKPDKNVWDVNGTANILSMCVEHSIDRVVYVSSVHAIPERPVPEIIEETDQFFPDFLPAEQREKAEEIKECQEDFAAAQELRAYIQGYEDCVQALYHMGLLKENEGLKWIKEADINLECL